jgi:hypothetical protein
MNNLFCFNIIGYKTLHEQENEKIIDSVIKTYIKSLNITGQNTVMWERFFLAIFAQGEQLGKQNLFMHLLRNRLCM